MAHNRNFYSTFRCSWKHNPTKRNLWERWKGRLEFFTQNPDLLNKWHETLQHPEDFRNGQKLRKQKGIWIISAWHWFSWSTLCFQNYSNFRAISTNRKYWFQSQLQIREKLKKNVWGFLNFIFKCKCFNVQKKKTTIDFDIWVFLLWFWRIVLLRLFVCFLLYLFCFVLFICFSLCGRGIFVWGDFLCCFLLGFFFVCFSWETVTRQSKEFFFFQESQILALVQAIFCSQQLKSCAIRA